METSKRNLKWYILLFLKEYILLFPCSPFSKSITYGAAVFRGIMHWIQKSDHKLRELKILLSFHHHLTSFLTYQFFKLFFLIVTLGWVGGVGARSRKDHPKNNLYSLPLRNGTTTTLNCQSTRVGLVSMLPHMWVPPCSMSIDGSEIEGLIIDQEYRHQIIPNHPKKKKSSDE